MRSIRNSLYYGTLRALRAFRIEPSFAWLMMIGFALSIVVTAIPFSVVDAVILRPWPFQQASRLAVIWATQDQLSHSKVLTSGPVFLDMQRQLRDVGQLAVEVPRSFGIKLPDSSIRVNGRTVSSNFFNVLGSRFYAGNGFLVAQEHATEPSVVISYRLWNEIFHSDMSILGKAITLDDHAVQVTAILPETFHFDYLADEDIWMSMSETQLQATSPTGHAFLVMIRLNQGRTLLDLNQHLQLIGPDIRRNYPEVERGLSLVAEPLSVWLLRDSPQVVLTAAFIIFLVALIAIGNISAFFVARSARSLDQVKIRLALGARLIDIGLESLIEGLTFAFCGLLASLILLILSLPHIAILIPPDIPKAREITFDWRILLFSVTCALVGALASTLPSTIYALKALGSGGVFRTDLSGKRDARLKSRIRNCVMGFQFALLIVVSTVAILAGMSLLKLGQSRLGFSPKNVVTIRINSPYRDDEKQTIFFDNVVRDIKLIPGIESASVTTSFPLSGIDTFVQVAKDAAEFNNASHGERVGFRAIGEGFFQTLAIPILGGRDFIDDDDKSLSPRVVIINAALAKRLWSNQSAIGERLAFKMSKSEPPIITSVVGVVADVQYRGLAPEDVEPEIFVPSKFNQFNFMYLVAREDGDHRRLSREIERSVSALNDKQYFELKGPVRLADDVSKLLQRPTFYGIVLVTLSAASILLAMYGLYGVVSHSVEQRSNEVGVRRCLGANFRDILFSTTSSIIKALLAGILIGTLCCIYVGPRVVQQLKLSVHYGTGVQVVVVILALVCATIAIVVPLRRTMQMEPAQLLRHE
jgi:putative ABC transport system permease protein